METVESLCNQLARSKLLAPDAVRTIHKRWKTEAQNDAADIGRFSKWLVSNGFLTDFQFGVLQRGFIDLLFLDDYKLLERIGQGRMAGVYKAVHKFGQIVAVKVLPPSKAKQTQTLARFQREARMSVKLRNANVVRTFHIGKTKGGLHYLVMEYLDGSTLDEVLQRRGKLPTEEALHVVLQALQGLEHLHAAGLVHRDLKPANLMLVPPPRDTVLRSLVKILDIGLGRALFDENTPDEPMDELTNEGAILGTPNYMAPEQARNAHGADIRADIYSLGCTLYHCLTGQPPFPDSSVVRQIVRHATEPLRPLSDFLPDVPVPLQVVVDRMLAKDPAQRYKTPAEAAQALDALVQHLAQPAAAPAEPAAPLRSYLTWLEEAPESEDAELVEAAPPVNTPAPVSVAAPVAAPAAQAVAAPAAAPVKIAVPVARPVAAAPAAAPLAVPVTVPKAITPTAKAAASALTQRAAALVSKVTVRDLIAAGIGAGAMLVLNLLLWALLRLRF